MDGQERDLYDVLGVARDAPPEAIRHAFRSRAREVHPDVSGEPDAVVRFSELSRAHEVLSRPSARLLYDRFGYVSRRNLGTRPARPRPAPAREGRPERPVTRYGRGEMPIVVPAQVEVVRRVPRVEAEVEAPRPAPEPAPAPRRESRERRAAPPAAERDTRLIRYASAFGALLAAALFVTLAFVPGAL